MSEDALRITALVASLQREMRCGICCSTFKDPILSTCYHIFCRSCMNSCFERKRKVQCPICRTVLDKRSCRDAYQITMAVQNYLKLSEAFKQDIENMNTFRTLPPEKAFLESQMPLDVTIIPENDGKRCAPDFAIPLLPVRRKRTSRPPASEEPSTSTAHDFNVFAAPKPIQIPEKRPKSFALSNEKSVAKPVEKKVEKKDRETLTEPLVIRTKELRTIDIQRHINATRRNGEKIDDIDALFQLIPSMRQFLQKNVSLLMDKFGVPTTTAPSEAPQESRKSLEKPEKRVSFANSQELERHRYPDPSESTESLKLPEPSPVELPKPVEKGGESEDEVVEDSEEEGEENTTTVDANSTPKAVQSEAQRIDEELSRVPKTIVCSRIHNDEDEVELLSDFYHKFLSNSCRFAEDVNAHTTHLVMMNSEDRTIPQKSTAYLQAIARKCIILGRQWLVDCLKTGLLLSEADYTITKCTSSIIAKIPPNPQMGWLRARNDEHGKLFNGCRFMILRKFTMNIYFDYKKLIELVQLCGGKILDSYDNLAPENLYIIFSKHSKSIGESLAMEGDYQCPVVTMEWVLDSISEYTLLPTDAYRAFNSIGDGHNDDD